MKRQQARVRGGTPEEISRPESGVAHPRKAAGQSPHEESRRAKEKAEKPKDRRNAPHIDTQAHTGTDTQAHRHRHRHTQN